MLPLKSIFAAGKISTSYSRCWEPNPRCFDVQIAKEEFEKWVGNAKKRKA